MKSANSARGKRGALVLIGGSEDKQGDMAILNRVLEEGGSRHITVVPSASGEPEKMAVRYTRAFSDLGAAHVEVLDIRAPDEADAARCLRAAEETDAIFFTGGDQVRLVRILEGSAFMEIVRERHARGMAVAGTSAGAAAASDTMIYEGDGEGYLKETVHHAPGFGFLSDIAVDTHFVVRGRIARLIQVLAGGLASRGIGLAEDTAAVFDGDGRFEVVGSGVVVVLNGGAIGYSNYGEIDAYDTISVEGVRMGMLSPGTVFDLETWQIRRPASVTADAEGRSLLNRAVERFLE